MLINASNSFHSTFRLYSAIANADTKATSAGGDKWNINHELSWDGNNEAQFYGIAPYGDYAGATATNPVITYESPKYAPQQEDIMAAKTSGTQYGGAVNFPFIHILAGVKFKIGAKGLANPNDKTVIKQIKIKNIYTKGTYNIETDSWTYSETGDVQQAEDWSGMSLAGKGIAENQMITSDAEGTTFLVMPQQDLQTTGTTLEITISENGVEKIVTANLKGAWKQGYTKTYNITSTKELPGYVIEVENHPIFNYLAQSVDFEGFENTINSFTVRSYKNDIDKTPVSWKIAGYKLQNADGTWSSSWTNGKPSLTTSDQSEGSDKLLKTGTLLNNGTGGGAGEERTVVANTSKPNAIVDTERREQALRSRSALSGEIDLSMVQVDQKTAQSGRTTANSYIVSYPSTTYKFPCVIGNMLKNGSVNTTALGSNPIFLYKRFNGGTEEFNGTEYGTFPMFADYMGNAVSADNYKLDNAVYVEVLWENTENERDLIEDVSLVTEGNFKYVKFKTSDNTKLKQGNALIAVKDNNGTIMWSWHIYVTDLDWTQTLECENTLVANHHPYYFAKEFLGFVEDKINGNHYDPRGVRLLIKQDDANGTTAEVSISQIEHTDLTDFEFHGTHYQFGRKDPHLAAFAPCSKGGIFRKDGTSLTQPQDYQENIYIHTAHSNPTARLRCNDKYTQASSQSWYLIGYYYTRSAEKTYMADKYVLWDANGCDSGKDVEDTYWPDNKIVKTIYDPCPPGFSLPPEKAFSFMINASSISGRTESKMTDPTWNGENETFMKRGVKLFTKVPADENTPTLLLARIGWVGTIKHMGYGDDSNQSDIWAGESRRAARACVLSLDFTGNLMRMTFGFRGTGQGVQSMLIGILPIKEE